MADHKKYDLLEEKFEYDEAAATQLAEATTELVEVERRATYLRDVIKRHKKLTRFLWGTSEGKVIAMHDLEQSHLINILDYLPRQGREPSKELLAEARKRGLRLEQFNGMASLKSIVAQLPNPFEDDEEYWDNEDSL